MLGKAAVSGRASGLKARAWAEANGVALGTLGSWCAHYRRCDECLNHKLQSKVARVYIPDRREADQRRAFDALGRRLAELVDGRAEADGRVVPLRAA